MREIKQQRLRFVRSALRKASLRWPPRYEAKNKARIKRGVYLCAGFERTSHEVRAKDIQVDHIKPIGELKDWNSWINRLFCSEKNLQALCQECHKAKTRKEGSE